MKLFDQLVIRCIFTIWWWRGVTVMHFIWSMKLLYARPG